MKPIPPPPAVEYPESDGIPLESDRHRDLMVDLVHALRRRFRDDPLFYATGDLFVYYEEGNPQASVGPDVFAVKGVPSGQRPIYKVWEEGKPPEFVIELTSRGPFDAICGRRRRSTRSWAFSSTSSTIPSASSSRRACRDSGGSAASSAKSPPRSEPMIRSSSTAST